MESFQIKYSESRNVMISIAGAMFSLFVLIMLMLFTFEKIKLNNDTEFILIFGVLILGVIFMIVAIVSFIKIKGVISFTSDRIDILLEKTNLLYKKKESSIPFINIKNIVLDKDNYNRKVISITTKQPSFTILLEPQKNDDNDNFEQYWYELDKNIQLYNKQIHQPELQIQHKSMYEQWWAKLLAIICAVLAIGICITKIVDQDAISTWRLVAFLAYTIPFCFIVYQANKKKK